MTISLPSGLFTKYGEIADLMLDQSGFGVPCKLVYTDKIQVVNSQSPNSKQKKIMNLQQISPDNSFSRADQSFKTIENTENITLRVYWTQKDFKKISSAILPDGSIMTIGKYSDLSKINKSIALIIQTAKTGHEEWRFEKSGEPAIHGLDNNYIMCYWKRI
jgi:hypothetical protein